MSLLVIEGLRLGAGGRVVVDGIDLTLDAGEALGLVGASGSGKTTMALAVLGHCRDGVTHLGGQVRVDGRPVLPRPPPGVRGTVVGYLGQDPGSSLNPHRTVGASLVSALAAARRSGGRGARRAAAVQMLGRFGLDPEIAGRHAHQLSGGQQQRVALALALAARPRLLVLDEPTTGLDPLARDEVLAELDRLRADGLALLWVSHDLPTLTGRVGRVMVLEDGRGVEHGAAGWRPGAPVSTGHARVTAVERPVDGVPGSGLVVRGLVARHGGRTPVLDGVGFAVVPGRCLAVVGPSGAGKTTLARCVVGLHRTEGGEITLAGRTLAATVQRRTVADRAAVGYVPQSPSETLHPRQSVRTALARPLRVLRGLRDPGEIDAQVGRLLGSVGLEATFARRLPAELSGGQRQRVALARALAGAPRVLVCDEITSALDTAARDDLIALLATLRARDATALIVITHDRVVSEALGDHALVLGGA